MSLNFRSLDLLASAATTAGMVDIDLPISSKRFATWVWVVITSSCFSLISEKSELVLPMAERLASTSITRLAMA